MRVSSVILRVSDLEQGVEFWSGLVGFPVLSRVPGFAFLDGGPLQLVLNLVESVPVGSLTEVVIEVDDVGSAYAGLAERGVPFEVDLRPVTGDEIRQLHAAHFRDPDGNLASLTGWVESA